MRMHKILAITMISSCVSFFTLPLNAQELHISFKEEFALDVEPCKPGVDCPCPLNTEPMMLSYDDDDNYYVCSANQKRSIQEEDLPPSEDQSLLDISVMIHLGLNHVRETDLALDAYDDYFVDLSFQEYFSLEYAFADDDTSECPQGFQAVMHPELPRVVLQFDVCPLRQTYKDIQAMHPHFLVFAPVNAIPFSLFFSVENYNTESERGGYQHFLLDQEYLAMLPCFPGSYCKGGGGMFSLPTACPVGTYGIMYGQTDCSTCPFDGTGTEQCPLNSSIEKVLISSEMHLFPHTAPPQSYSEIFAEQRWLKDTILQWIMTSLQNSDEKTANNSLEMHILSWETVFE